MMRFRYHDIKSITKNRILSQPIDTAAIRRCAWLYAGLDLEGPIGGSAQHRVKPNVLEKKRHS
jgi:hypothetical protein